MEKNSLKKEAINSGVYAGHGEWYQGLTNFYESVRGIGSMEKYSEYLLSLDGKVLDNIMNVAGIESKDILFVADQNSQDYEGNYNGEYTIIAK